MASFTEVEFYTPFRLTDVRGEIVEVPEDRDLYLPTVEQDSNQEIHFDGSSDTEWDTATRGMSNQDRYTGPVLHPSETLSLGMWDAFYEQYGKTSTFAVVEVYHDEEDEPGGWTVIVLER